MLQPTNFSVLMVDDTTAIREAIARSLARRGCRVTTATNGVEALEILRKQSFDVIITDLNMPDRGGLLYSSHPSLYRSHAAWRCSSKPSASC